MMKHDAHLRFRKLTLVANDCLKLENEIFAAVQLGLSPALTQRWQEQKRTKAGFALWQSGSRSFFRGARSDYCGPGAQKPAIGNETAAQ